MDLRQVVGENVRAARTRQGLSQEEVAFRARIHTTYLSGVENGRRNPTVLVLGRIADAISLQAADLLKPRLAIGGDETFIP